MDGAPPASPNIEAGHDFTYRFSLPHPGTYWAHPHTGLDADYGLYLPVIVDDPKALLKPNQSSSSSAAACAKPRG
jgi:FtsP/CotA-like multicopper oxidase with cupredoxin domain